MQHNIRDLITFKKFQDDLNHPKSLKKLSLEFLEKKIQQGEHSSVVDGRAALGLYRIVEHQWTQQMRSKTNKLKRVRIEAESTLLGSVKKRMKKVEK